MDREQRDGWMDGWTDGWMDRGMDGQRDEIRGLELKIKGRTGNRSERCSGKKERRIDKRPSVT